ncbi:uncharacterized protein LOC127787190 isoform X2 [Diospyros lotus]|uniref:uncharacterized protein LOC127787190 isoform X2 n=1 Tax=Diospyros lotus TaxID=55363 RepID=UPI00225265FC|nr:uncharacterized protein LOC127787190 isoform X2 [Diospyros lotus]
MQHSEPTGGDDSVGKNIAIAVSQGLVCIEREYSEGKLDKGSDVYIIGGNTAEIHNQANPSQPSVSGVQTGMFLRDAKALCPHLVNFAFNFEAYEEGKPVAICHSDNPRGTGEISSLNYLARGFVFGVRGGMFLRDAKALCPHLVIFAYNFEAYNEVNSWYLI